MIRPTGEQPAGDLGDPKGGLEGTERVGPMAGAGAGEHESGIGCESPCRSPAKHPCTEFPSWHRQPEQPPMNVSSRIDTCHHIKRLRWGM